MTRASSGAEGQESPDAVSGALPNAVESTANGSGDPGVRAARPADAAAIAGLLAGFARLGMVRDRTVDDVRRDLGGFLVAEVEGRVVGSVALRIHSPSLYEIASLSVAEGFHGRGLGRRLVQGAVLRAHARGVRRLFAFTLRVRLFEQLGFRVAPLTDFPQKLAVDYGGTALAAGHKSAVVLDLETAGRGWLPRTPARAPSRELAGSPPVATAWEVLQIAARRVAELLDREAARD